MDSSNTEGSREYGTSVPIGRRACSRVRLRLPAKVMLLGGTSACTLESLSACGARIVSDKDLEEGSAGVLECDGVKAFFTVAWAQDHRFGLEFDKHQPDQLLRDLRWHSDHFDLAEELQRETFAREWVEGEIASSPSDHEGGPHALSV